MTVTREIIESTPIKDWYELLVRKEQYSHYIDRPFEYLIKNAQGELSELLAGIQNQDRDNIHEEIADVIFDVYQLLQALFKQELITPEEFQTLGQREKAKIYKRQPYIRDNQKLSSREEETALFKKLKEQC